MIKNIGLFFLSLFTSANLQIPLLPIFGNAPPKEKLYPTTLARRIVSVGVPESITASGLLVFDVGTGTRIAEKGSERPLPIASITKVMTGYVALSKLSPNTSISISNRAVETPGEAGNFKPGEVFLLRDLLAAMMMYSSNDAAMAIAERIGEELGGVTFDEKISTAVAAMNETASLLEMSNTSFINPTGLDSSTSSPSNFSSAGDLTKLIRATDATPLLWDASRDQIKIIKSESGVRHQLINTNSALQHIPHVIGGKTGSTETAGDSVIVLYEYPLGNPQILILLGALPGKRFEEAEFFLSKITPMLL